MYKDKQKQIEYSRNLVKTWRINNPDKVKLQKQRYYDKQHNKLENWRLYKKQKIIDYCVKKEHIRGRKSNFELMINAIRKGNDWKGSEIPVRTGFPTSISCIIETETDVIKNKEKR